MSMEIHLKESNVKLNDTYRSIWHRYNNKIWKMKYGGSILKRHMMHFPAFIWEKINCALQMTASVCLRHTKQVVGVAMIFIVSCFVVGFTNAQKKVDIYIDGACEKTVYAASFNSVEDVLRKSKVEIDYNDFVSPSLDSKLESSTAVYIFKPTDMTVQYENNTYNVSTPLNGEMAVRQAGLYMSDGDLMDIDYETNTIQVTTLDIVEEVQYIDLSFETETVKNDNEYTDYEEVVQEGKAGRALATVVTTYQNGEVVSKEELISELIEAPQNKVVEVGTKKRPVVSTYSGEAIYASSYVASMTAYCPCSICCGAYSSGYTANGARATQYVTVAAPSHIPFGTRVYIPALSHYPNGGYFTVQDRGGAIQGNRIDVYFDSHSEALRFGRKSLQIYILE